MPSGERPTPAPKGYMRYNEVKKLIGKNFYKWVASGHIEKYTPPNMQQGFYKESDVLAVYHARSAYDVASRQDGSTETTATFQYATLGDAQAIYDCAIKFFPRPASAEVRRGWMRKEPRGHYIVKRLSDSSVVAYMYMLALKPQYLDAYMSGMLPGRMITPDHIDRFAPGQPMQSVIINAIQGDPTVPIELRSRYVAMLLRGMSGDLAELGKEGIDIPKIYAWSETKEGIALCAKLGMDYWKMPEQRRVFFVLDVAASSARLVRAYQSQIAHYRATQNTTPAHKERSGIIAARTLDARNEVQHDGTLTLAQFAKELGIARSTLRELVQKYDLPHVVEDIPNRPSEKQRFFTPEQQDFVRSWRAAHARKKM